MMAETKAKITKKAAPVTKEKDDEEYESWEDLEPIPIENEPDTQKDPSAPTSFPILTPDIVQVDGGRTQYVPQVSSSENDFGAGFGLRGPGKARISASVGTQQPTFL
ncbi:hypothetical protein HK102_003810 [Quaeritorhiza haematococci]|nr:hypothetical protein HK102_003810 [Quaeritorhiza haematococci]